MTQLASLAARTFAELLDDQSLDAAIVQVQCSRDGMLRLYLSMLVRAKDIDHDAGEPGVFTHLKDAFRCKTDQDEFDLRAILLDIFHGERRVRQMKRRPLPEWVTDFPTPVVDCTGVVS